VAIYEYKCQVCGEVLEVLQYPGEDEPRECPRCGGNQLVRLISRPTVIRKGGLPKGGTTCCGRAERCDTPPCSEDRVCKRED
jgi:putative FmdB family regulatory protein